jgi:hypothetical protein
VSADPSLFEVAVGDDAVRVVVRHKQVLDPLGEMSMSEQGLVGRGEDHSTNARLVGGDRTQHRWMVRHDLCESGGSLLQQAVGQVFEVIQVVADVGRDMDPVLVSVLQV